MRNITLKNYLKPSMLDESSMTTTGQVKSTRNLIQRQNPLQAQFWTIIEALAAMPSPISFPSQNTLYKLKKRPQQFSNPAQSGCFQPRLQSLRALNR